MSALKLKDPVLEENQTMPAVVLIDSCLEIGVLKMTTVLRERYLEVESVTLVLVVEGSSSRAVHVFEVFSQTKRRLRTNGASFSAFSPVGLI